jgi:dipeptidyl aminopeptidase/acylaminoacyl peptidase
VYGLNWHPDSRRIALYVSPNNLPGSGPSNLFLVDPFEASATPRRLTTNPGGDFHPMWTPDGQWIVYRTRQTPGRSLTYHRLFRIPTEGGALEDISPKADLQPRIEGGYLTGYVFAPDGRQVFFGASTGTTEGLFAMPLDTRIPVRLTPDVGLYSGASFSTNRQAVAFVFESPDEPAEIYAASIEGLPGSPTLARVRRLTSHNQHAKSFAVGKTEVVRWKSRDGREIEGLVVLPAGWSNGDGPRALVTNIHGGPAQVRVQSFQAAGFDSDAQRYAADGYAVFLPNPRGSSGYGEASILSIREDWGGRDFEDIMTGIDYLIDRGIAHRDSLGVMGWSYGGYMTARAVTQTDRFKAAVAGAPITDLLANWGSAEANVHLMIQDYYLGGPYQPGRWKLYQRSNPMPSVTRVTTPTMVIHGTNDRTVPIEQGRMFFRALRANGVPTKLVWLPRTGHWPGEPGIAYEAVRHQKEWFDRWVRGR